MPLEDTDYAIRPRDTDGKLQPIEGETWIIHKHRLTGELLGPCVSMECPTRVVHAVWMSGRWRELN